MTDEPIDCGDPWCFACWLVRFEKAIEQNTREAEEPARRGDE